MSNVTFLRETGLENIPALLRKLAADIEDGAYGEVQGCAVVLNAVEMPIFGFGNASAPEASELFACAHQKLVMQRLASAGAII